MVLMDKKSKYLLLVFAALAVAVVFFGYRTFFIERDFIVRNTIPCDPQTEVCFMSCTDDVCEEDYYKKIIKNAKNIPLCNPAVGECEPLVCEPREEDCEIVSCSSESVEEGEICTNPLNFMFETKNTESTSTTTTL